MAGRFVWRAVATLWMAVGVAGCGGGGGSSPPPPPPVAVTVQPVTPVAMVKLGEQAGFSAVVTGSSNTAVTWSLSGPGCSGAACGSIAADGVFSAPAIVPQPPTVNVIATAQADPSKSASYAITIGSDVALALWPQSARLALGADRQFLRTLTGSSNADVTWRVTGMGCDVANCGSVSDGRYVAPPVRPPNAATVFVVATSVVDPGKSAQAAVSLLDAPNGLLQGTYVFGNRGVSAGVEGVSAGMFVADGLGALRSGTVDRSLPVAAGGKLVDVPITGSYSLGADHTGTLTLALPLGNNEWRVAVNASGDKAFMQAYFDPAVRSSTVLYKADPAQFSNAGVNGTYTFLLEGANAAGERVANIGRFTANGAGSITNGALDSNEGGQISSASFTGSYSVAQNGRAAVTLTIGGRNFGFAMYVVNADMVILSANEDTATGVPARMGTAWRQTGGPYSAASLAGDYVFELAGRRSADAAVVTVGRLSSAGAGTASGQYDRDDDDAITLGASLDATYSVDAAGRGTLGSAQLGQLVFQLVSPDKALIMGAPDARVHLGTLERQRAAPYSTANLRGEFVQGTAAPAALNSLTVTARAVYDGMGSETSTQFVNAAAPCGQASGSTTAPYAVSANGRFAISDGAGGPLAAGYLIDPGRYVLILQRPSGSACDEVVQVNYAEQ